MYDSSEKYWEDHDEYTNHNVALERKFNNYDYQDISDLKLNTSKSAKIRASISGASVRSAGSRKTSRTNRSTKTNRTSKSAKVATPPREYNKRLSSSMSVMSGSSLNDSMNINMRSVAIQQKHIQFGATSGDKSVSTNYDKQRVRMHTEKQALSPTGIFDMQRTANSLYDTPKYEQVQAMSYSQYGSPKMKHKDSNRSLKSSRSRHSGHNSTHHQSNGGSHSRRPSRGSDSHSLRSANSKHKSHHHHHQNHHQLSYQQYSQEDYFIEKQTSTHSFHDDIAIMLEEEEVVKPGKNSVSSSATASTSTTQNTRHSGSRNTPMTSVENSPLNKPRAFPINTNSHRSTNHQSMSPNQELYMQEMFQAQYMMNSASTTNVDNNEDNIADIDKHLTSIVEVSTPRDHSFNYSHSTLSNSAKLRRKNSRLSQVSRKSRQHSKQPSITSPKAVFSLEDTLRADEDFRDNVPTKEEFTLSVHNNMSKKAPSVGANANGSKKISGSKLKNFFAVLFGRKAKSDERKKIEVINQRIGVY